MKKKSAPPADKMEQISIPADAYTSHGVSMWVQTITPETALEWLTVNENNRSLKIAHAASLARDIVAGRWHLNGAPIRFVNGEPPAPSWQLVDGQHRLTAIMDSGVSVESAVVVFDGLTKESATNTVRTMDAAVAPRTTAEILQYQNIKNATVVAAAVGFVERYHRGASATGGVHFKHSPTEVADLVTDKYDGLIDSAALANNSKLTGLSRGGLAAFHYLASQVDEQLAADATKYLMSGLGQDFKTDAFALFREKVINNRTATKRTKIPGWELVCMLFKAWELERRGEPVRIIKLSTTNPTVLTLLR